MRTRISFGITIEKDGKKFSLTGLCPSATSPTPEAALNTIVNYINAHAGTDLVLVEEFGAHLTVTETALDRGSALRDRSKAFHDVLNMVEPEPREPIQLPKTQKSDDEVVDAE